MRLSTPLLLLLLALGPSACPPPAPTPPPPQPTLDGGGQATCATLCANLKLIGCPEGQADNCVSSCTKLSTIEDMHVTCGTTAVDQNAAHTCGIRCGLPAKH